MNIRRLGLEGISGEMAAVGKLFTGLVNMSITIFSKSSAIHFCFIYALFDRSVSFNHLLLRYTSPSLPNANHIFLFGLDHSA